LRDYGIEPVIWDGDKNCKHEWITHIKKPNGGMGSKGANVGANKNDFANMRDHNIKSDFCSKCGAWRGSLGLEPNFELYIRHLCSIFDEVKRVLRKDGTCWVNLGDTYASNGGASRHFGYQDPKYKNGRAGNYIEPSAFKQSVQPKSLCLIPQRFAIEMTNRGWILRNTIIWHKPNCMPSSAKDRFTVDFEYVYFFTKSNKTQFWTNEKTLECVNKKPLGIKGIEGKDWEWREIGKNYSTCDTKIDNELAESLNSPRARKYRDRKLKKVSLWIGHDYWFEQQFEPSDMGKPQARLRPNGLMVHCGALGYSSSCGGDGKKRNKRAVWKIPTKPFPEAHFAVFPEALIEPSIKAGCPEFVCKKCGKARVKMYEKDEAIDIKNAQEDGTANDTSWNKNPKGHLGTPNVKVIGYTDCGCNAGFEGGIVLDPFMGAGTTAVVAKNLSRNYIGIELNPKYISIAEARIKAVPNSLFRGK